MAAFPRAETHRPRRAALLAAAVAGMMAFGGAGAWADEAAGRARAVGGATIEIAGQRLRLDGIAAPDGSWRCLSRKGRAYDCADIARETLASFLRGVEVACTPAGRDRCNRELATCRVRRADLGLQMVISGWAVADGPEGGRYKRAERSAQTRRQGLWRGRFERPADAPCPRTDD